MAAKKAPDNVLELVGKFVQKQKGQWNHPDWERFVNDAEKLGYDLNDEARRHLGNLIEGAGHFFNLPSPAAPKKAAAKKKPAAKPKAKAAKPKPKAKAAAKAPAKKPKAKAAKKRAG